MSKSNSSGYSKAILYGILSILLLVMVGARLARTLYAPTKPVYQEKHMRLPPNMSIYSGYLLSQRCIESIPATDTVVVVFSNSRSAGRGGFLNASAEPGKRPLFQEAYQLVFSFEPGGYRITKSPSGSPELQEKFDRYTDCYLSTDSLYQTTVQSVTDGQATFQVLRLPESTIHPRGSVVL